MTTRAWRIVDNQSVSFYQSVEGLTTEEAIELNIAIEKTKPYLGQNDEQWHELIYTPFRYPLPVGLDFGARFRPPLSSKNVFYCSFNFSTAASEAAHHTLRERIHLKGLNRETIIKTSFCVEIITLDNFLDIRNEPNLSQIMSDNYSYSHAIAMENEGKDGFIYPSARKSDGLNYAITNINSLGKDVINQENCFFQFDPANNEINVLNHKNEFILNHKTNNIFTK